MRVALDTNVLVYAEGINGPERQSEMGEIIAALPDGTLVCPLQVLGELYHVLTRKARWPREQARAAVSEWRNVAHLQPTTSDTLTAALDLAADHKFSIWDAIIVNVAAEAGCRVLLSEDMQHGFVWRGMTVIDPFRPERHPLLAAALG